MSVKTQSYRKTGFLSGLTAGIINDDGYKAEAIDTETGRTASGYAITREEAEFEAIRQLRK
ncbi:hypothetical protein ACFOMD_15465 [Sphingoaurantiacus capsulatus]|uniref:Uncharacterized protein n=1 Tax=Sphingoaurantiacus capsulatus TaxID=1771310 RepID=A0ABV7XCT2_9SPHN